MLNASYRVAVGTACIASLSRAGAEEFNIPGGDMKSALDAYAKQTRVQLIYSDDVVKGSTHEKARKATSPPDAALTHLLSGSGLNSLPPISGCTGNRS